MPVYVAWMLALVLSGLVPPLAAEHLTGNGQVAVLMYHHFAPTTEREEEPGVITPERFAAHLQMLRDEGYRLITADQFAAYLDGKLMLPGQSVLLTFDDGYASNYHLGFPIMQRYQAPGLIFPVGRYFESEGEGAWSPHLSREQMTEMMASGLVALGGHSYDGHGMVATGAGGQAQAPWLGNRAWLAEEGRSETDAEYLRRISTDLRRNRALMRGLGVTGDALHFALPNGSWSEEALTVLAELGFRYIYSTDPSQVNRPGVKLIYRIDAGSPHADVAWLKDALTALFTPPPE